LNSDFEQGLNSEVAAGDRHLENQDEKIRTKCFVFAKRGQPS